MDKKQKGLFLVMLMSVIWALQITMSKLALSKGIPVFVFLFQMLLFATLIVCVFVGLFHRQKILAVSKTDIRNMLLIAMIGTATANIIGYYGLEHSSSINYGFLVKTTVVFTVILAHFILNEYFNSHKMALVILLLVGVYLITTNAKELVPNKFDILIVLSAFCYALANNIAKKTLDRISSEILAMYRMVFGMFFIMAFIPFINESFFVFNHLQYVLATAALLSGMMIMLYRTLEITSASYLSMMSMLTPIVVTILGVVFLKESFSFIQALGGGLIIISGVFIHKKDI